MVMPICKASGDFFMHPSESFKLNLKSVLMSVYNIDIKYRHQPVKISWTGHR